MTDTPTCPPLERVPLRAVIDRAAAAIAAKTPFSLVRLGDGEGFMMSASLDRDSDRVKGVLSCQFGHTDVNPEDLRFIANALRRSVASADVVGLPTPFQFDKDLGYRRVFDAIAEDGLCSPPQLLTDANVHWYLQWSGGLAELIGGRDRISLITSRELAPQISETFCIGSVRNYPVRGEDRFPGRETERHWPDRFTALLDELRHLECGTVFLVGAGVLGKIYCDCIKANGGIAIDIGSVFDAWAGVVSRLRYGLGSSAFTLGHFAATGADWTSRIASLERCIAEFDIRTATY